MPILDYDQSFFDVHVELHRSSVPPGTAPETALSTVRSAVRAMAGAGGVSVEWSEDVRASATRVRVEEAAGGQLTLDLAALGRLAVLVEAVINKTLLPDPALATLDRPLDYRN